MAGLLCVPYMGLSLATATLVGNELGRGNPSGAKQVSGAAPLIHPLILSAIAAAMLIPSSRAKVINLLAESGSAQLRATLNWVLPWLVLHIGIDGL